MNKIREEILNNVDIIDEVQNYVKLEKIGQNYKCICPFHNDTNPSLTVSKEKQIFKCFVCGEGGTVIEFVQKYEKIAYKSALEKLGSKIGIKVETKKQSNLNSILDNISLFYEKILHNSELGEEALKYLKETRQLDDEEINKFSLGYSPASSDVLYKYITNRIKEENYSVFDLEKLNIFNEKNQDILSDRVIFPIRDEHDALVGFSGRTMSGNVKYINSKNSEVFNKKKILYNFNEVVKSNNKDVIIVEGFFDVITAYKNDIPSVVATMGVAFSQDHIKLLKKYNISDIYLGFDSDKAGQEATRVSAKLLIENNFNVKVLNYGEFKDIDEFLNDKHSYASLLKETALEYPIFMIKDIIEENLSIDEKAKVTNEICHILKYYSDGTKKELLIKDVADKLKIDERIILNQISTENIKVKKKVEVKEANINEKFLLFDREKILFYIISNDYNKFLELEEYIKLGKFEFWMYLKDYEKLKELYEEEQELDYITLLDELEFYNDIDKEFSSYKYMDITDIDINNYFNKDKKEKVNKMKKLF